MKKTLIAAVSLILILCLVSCGGTVLHIENYSWTLGFVQDADGDVTHASADQAENYRETYPQLQVVDCAFRAESGKFSIIDNKDDRMYGGVYRQLSAKGNESLYDISLNGKKGTAVLTETVHNNGNVDITFVISLGGEALYFYGK